MSDGEMQSVAMERERKVVERLYACFAAHDGVGMAACYAPSATFTDPVFPALRGAQVGAMWRMLTARATELVLAVESILEERGEWVVRWTARYPFTQTGRSVVNRVTSRIKLVDGLIVEQKDHFDFGSWLAQALGPFGSLLGWTGLPGALIRRGAAKNLATYQERNP